MDTKDSTEEAQPASPPTSPKSSPKAKPDSIFWVKATKFLQRDVLYICQNVNGPCPLLAIANVLLLRGHLTIDACVHATPGGQGYVYAHDIMELVQKRIATTNAHFSEAEKATVQEVIDLIPSLYVGLDVNVQFHGVDAFEYTSALAIFDLLAMRLVHGWIVDPQDVETASVIKNKSYNHIIETVIDHHSVGEDTEAAVTTMVKERSLSMELAAEKVEQVKHDGPIIESFLQESASQLTYAGLVELHEHGVRERELVVFFRNNHFSTLFKINGALYLLATDAGYYDEPSVIWEKLDEIDGDSEYFTCNFTPVVASDTKQQTLLDNKSLDEPSRATNHEDPDYLMALRLQEEENQKAKTYYNTPPSFQQQPISNQKPPSPQNNTHNDSAPTTVDDVIDPLTLTVEELRLQQEAEAYYKQQQIRAQRQAVANEGIRQQYTRREGGGYNRNLLNEGDKAGCRIM
ncbi:FAM63B-like [Thraustotheca clavata]|uniref:FAM63B-like n=1 Tax=Thraustotheca clavata TaxID=74557 RepID=A0A1V9ZLS3_9STRA|nr:FAM63B-like [Thraustotheca clavata]